MSIFIYLHCVSAMIALSTSAFTLGGGKMSRGNQVKWAFHASQMAYRKYLDDGAVKCSFLDILHFTRDASIMFDLFI